VLCSIDFGPAERGELGVPRAGARLRDWAGRGARDIALRLGEVFVRMLGFVSERAAFVSV
jgi:hypothetical protein